jgi:hypothetical protein
MKRILKEYNSAVGQIAEFSVDREISAGGKNKTVQYSAIQANTV